MVFSSHHFRLEIARVMFRILQFQSRADPFPNAEFPFALPVRYARLCRESVLTQAQRLKFLEDRVADILHIRALNAGE